MSHPLPRKSCRDHGFTLVEILVVIGIVVVLAVISFSAGRMLLTRARIIESTENLRSLAIANTTYAADYGVYCPHSDQSNIHRWHGSRKSVDAKFDPTTGYLSPYLGKSARVTTCPLFKAMVVGSPSFEDSTGGYGYNAAYIGGLPGGSFDSKTKIQISERPANVPNPGQTVMFTTAAYARPSGLQESAECVPPFWDYGSGPSNTRPSPTVHFRANGKALVAWCDGSVTAEAKNTSSPGLNPHGGDAEKWHLGWFGPDENNGYWNPKY